MGHLGHRAIGPLGGRKNRWCTCRAQSLAMAGCAGCCPGRRLRHDSSPDPDTNPYRFHAHRRAGAGVHCHDPRESDSAEQSWPRGCLPGFQRRVCGWVGEGLVLGRACFSVVHLRGLLCLLSQRATFETLT